MTAEEANSYGYSDGEFDGFTGHEYDAFSDTIPAEVDEDYRMGYRTGYADGHARFKEMEMRDW